jgi:hypothetical protein
VGVLLLSDGYQGEATMQLGYCKDHASLDWRWVMGQKLTDSNWTQPRTYKKMSDKLISKRMSSEHRWSARRSQHLDVALFNNKMSRLPVRTRNISLGGMFVETGISLPVNASVTLGFTLQAGERVSHHRLMASVVRLSEDGLGLMYDHLDDETVRSMREILYGPISCSLQGR